MTFSINSVTVIQPNILENKDIMTMSKLTIIFNEMLEEDAHCNVVDERNHHVKKYLQQRYPEIIFRRPSHRGKSDIVYVNELFT